MLHTNLHVGVQHGPQRAQEAQHVLQQLLGLQEHHDHQGAVHHIGRGVRRAVQAVPAARLRVTAAVAHAVAVVVGAVLVVSEGRKKGGRFLRRSAMEKERHEGSTVDWRLARKVKWTKAGAHQLPSDIHYTTCMAWKQC